MKAKWQLEKRWCGHNNCFSTNRTVLSLGHWSVSGSTGSYVVTSPDGWDIERKEPFATEQEAMAWVENQLKKESCQPSQSECHLCNAKP